jgi:hypothetical protein
MRTKFAFAASSGILILSAAPALLAQSTQDRPQATPLQAQHFSEKPPVQFEVIQTADHQPRMIITNLYHYPLTAFVVRTDPTAPNSISNTLVCDALARVGLLAPIARGLNFVMGVPHPVGQPVPDPVLAAAVWEDGSTFGPDDLLARMLKTRAILAVSYDRAIALLQTGLDKNWSAAEYAAAAEQQSHQSYPSESSAPETGAAGHLPFLAIKGNMERMDKQNRIATVVASAARNLLTHFTQERDALRRAAGESASSANLKN